MTDLINMLGGGIIKAIFSLGGLISEDVGMVSFVVIVVGGISLVLYKRYN